jgi:hypothetical protein
MHEHEENTLSKNESKMILSGMTPLPVAVSSDSMSSQVSSLSYPPPRPIPSSKSLLAESAKGTNWIVVGLFWRQLKILKAPHEKST